MNTAQITNLTKLFKNGRGIRHINLIVKKGEIMGLLGPNGSGKTTLMKAMLGLNRPSEGSISIFGMDIYDDFEKIMKKTGSLIESPAIYKDMSAYDNLRIAARMYDGVSKERIDECLEMMGLAQYKNDKAGRFSLGMKQRLGLCMAILHSPEFVLLDEPVNGLDIEGVVEIRDMIKAMSKKYGTSFLISSHIASEIEKTCTRAALMYNGEIIDCEEMDKILKLYPSVEGWFLDKVKEQRGSLL